MWFVEQGQIGILSAGRGLEGSVDAAALGEKTVAVARDQIVDRIPPSTRKECAVNRQAPRISASGKHGNNGVRFCLDGIRRDHDHAVHVVRDISLQKQGATFLRPKRNGDPWSAGSSFRPIHAGLAKSAIAVVEENR